VLLALGLKRGAKRVEPLQEFLREREARERGKLTRDLALDCDDLAEGDDGEDEE
jgi:hypothetical protein